MLHAIPPPNPGYYDRAYHRGWEPYFALLYDKQDTNSLRGPYNNCNDFLSALQAVMRKAADEGVRLHTEDYLAYCLPEMFTRGTTPTFTHWYTAPRNVFATRVHDGADDFIITLIDWAHAGWLPEWFEWVMIGNRMPDDVTAEGNWKWLSGLEREHNPQYVAEAELFRTYAQKFYEMSF